MSIQPKSFISPLLDEDSKIILADVEVNITYYLDTHNQPEDIKGVLIAQGWHPELDKKIFTFKIKDKVTEKVRLLQRVDNLPTDLITIFDISFEGSSGVPSVEWFNYL
jgi:hypothetical protein